MKLWNRVQDALQKWRSGNGAGTILPDEHLLGANRNLRSLLEDSRIPASVRNALAPEFADIEELAEKLEREELHIAVFGRVSTGKSSLCNALLGTEAFATSPLHGETREDQSRLWEQRELGHVNLIDTPGIDELNGQAREQLATRVARRADILIMVLDSDLVDLELQALERMARRQRPLLLVLNKADRYTKAELETLLERIRERCAPFLPADRVLSAAASPRAQTVIRVDDRGREIEETRARAPDVKQLKERLWDVLEREGKTLSALNAALFASELDSQLAARVVEARQEVAEKIIHQYCLGKGLAVALNPVPVADLLAAAGLDVAMVVHLGRVYGHSLSRREASKLLVTIAAQMLALMGAYWGINLVSSALKGISAGMTTVLTGAAQGALAWYATYVIGKAAESWFASGMDWGPDGPRQTVRNILDSLDRDSILLTAREEILEKLRSTS